MAETDAYALPVGYALKGRGDTYTLVDRGDGSAVLGQGGFGITYLALSKKFAQQVAVKELYVSTDNICRRTHANLIAIDKPKAFAALKQAFIKEAKTLAMFRAEHRIVDVLDIFEANNTQYLVMPYLKGKHFGELAKLEAFDEARVRDLIVQLATGLKKVHDKGLLHRDIKPDNIKLSEDGTYPILIDFGSSKEIDSKGSLYRTFAEGFSPWELYFTSTEKTPATDVYSLAATAHFLLLDETPPPASQRAEEWEAHSGDPKNVPVPVLATLDQAVASGKVSLQFGRALETALAFRARNRFQSLDAFVEAIVLDQSSSIEKRAPKPPRRLGQLVAGVALVVALVVALAAAYWTYFNPDHDGELAQDPQSWIAEPDKVARFERENLPEMVAIPAGRFFMGSPKGENDRDDDEGPQRWIDLEGFYLSSTEITVGQFRAFIDATNFAMGTSCWVWEGEWKEKDGVDWQSPGFSQDLDHPVTCVSWDEAQAYLAWVNLNTDGGYGFPSEAQWEYAARAGTTTAYSTGDLISADEANYDRNLGTTRSVGSYAANTWSLYDMHGNIWEWTQDCWNDDLRNHSSNGAAMESGDCERRVTRGGSWYDEPRNLRSADRFGGTTSDRSHVIGFRLLKTF